ncbi:MFS general substrate transporter [Trichocladium antarcticum]|uniref:MFS general substrate transporter n=1 Tax=Trichocladium antarcticum TaxID=1450529 RepID=A0AAN6ZDC4_9PEZI|nr:MFS general substrate transporter [Trichocladium antarcticum]
MADEKRGASSDDGKGVAGHTESAVPEQFDQSSVQLDPRAEAKLRNKLDMFLVPTVSLLYLFCFIDRANIGNAKIAGLDKDLGLEGYDYNALLSIFYISYIVFEIPSNIACKWLGPGWFLPAISLGFGIASVAMAFVHNFSQAAGVRFVLGMFEAGLMPGIAYYLSRWYRRSELTFRLSLYIVMAPMAGAFGGLLASAILTLDHVGSLTGWRMIFGIEGIITIGLSLISFGTLTDRPETARWLTPEERELATARIKSERVATTEVLDKMDWKKLISGVLNPVVLSTSLLFLLNNITVQGLAFFAPTIVRAIYPDKSTVTQQLFTVPPYVVGGFFTLLLPLISWRIDRRQIILIASTPLIIIGYSMFLGTTNPNARYAATFLLSSSLFSVGPLANSQVSANVVSDTARSSAIGLNVMMGNVGGLISTWSYLPFDGPNYPIGNGLNLAACCTVLLVASATLLWMNRDNRVRGGRNAEEELAGMSRQEVQDLDWKHPEFRWKP